MKAFEMLILKPKWSLDSDISLSSAWLFQMNIDFIYSSSAKNDSGRKQPAQLQNHTCKNKWLPTLSTTFLDLLKRSKTHMPRQCQTSSRTESISRWEKTVYIDQIMSKADAQGLQNYIADGYVQRFYSCVFKLWGKIKILIVAFLQTYFIWTILLPCCSVSSLIWPSELCAALVIHDLVIPCFWTQAGGLHLDGSYQMNAPFQVLKPLFFSHVGSKWGLMLSVYWRLCFAHTSLKYSTCNLFCF